MMRIRSFSFGLGLLLLFSALWARMLLDNSRMPNGLSFSDTCLRDGKLLVETEFYENKALIIDWASKVPPSLQKQVANLPDKLGLEYESPVDPDLQKLFFYLVTPENISALKLIKLIGSVSRDEASGRIEVVPDSGTRANGIVIISKTALSFKRTPLPNKHSGLLFPAIKELQPGHHLPGIQTLYELTATGSPDHFIFVQWEPDTSCALHCCLADYALYRKRQTLERLVWHQSQCKNPSEATDQRNRHDRD